MITLAQVIKEIYKWERFSTVPDKEKFPDFIKAYIMQETDCTQAESNVIYNYVHDKYTDDIVDTLEETIDFCNDLRKAREV